MLVTMNITMIGAGAMGCLMGGRLAQGGAHVSFIARGAQLAALREHGLTLSSEHSQWHGMVSATDDASTLGPQDAVILCTKAYQLPSAVAHLAPLLGDETLVVPAVNGVPWWYFEQHGGEFEGKQLANLDPDHVLKRAIDTTRIIGCVNYLAGTLTQPGHVHYVHEVKRRVVLGELGGTITPRLERLGAAFTAAGFDPVLTEDIRQAIWHKLWGNIAFNPISALTHGTIDQIAEGYHDIDLGSVDI